VILKPNRQEAETACRRLYGEMDYKRLRRHVRSRLLIITQGAEGVLVIEDETEKRVPTRPVANPVDICGAGDSFSADAALALAVSDLPVQAAGLRQPDGFRHHYEERDGAGFAGRSAGSRPTTACCTERWRGLVVCSVWLVMGGL
jgi:hypothetical protein